jgi:hypothetical protein
MAQNAWQHLPLPPGVTTTVEMRDVRFSPAGVLYVSFYSQGTWSSSDFGQSWQSIHYNLPNLPAGGFFSFNAQGEVLICPDDSPNFAIYRLPANGTTWIKGTLDFVQGNTDELIGKLVLTDTGKLVGMTSRLRMYRSTDGGQSFHYFALQSASTSGMIFSFNKSPVTNDLFVGTETGPEWISSDEGSTWSSIGKPGGNVRIGFNRQGTPFGETTHNANPIPRVLAKYAGGTTWVESDTGLPNYADSRSFALSPSGQMFVGNYDVFASSDDGSTWQLAGTGFPTSTNVIQVQCLCVGTDNNVYAGLAHATASTFGVWKLQVATSNPPVLTSIVVTPNSTSIVTGTTQQFLAIGKDQYGANLNPQPAFTWTVSGGGTMSANGLFTAASSAGGPFTVTATSGSVSGTAKVTVVNAPPVLTIIVLSPNSASISTGSTQQFSAIGKDQYGANLNPQPAFTWTVSGGGTVNSSGLFTAGSAPGGPFTVTAKSGNVTGTAQMTVTQPVNSPPTINSGASAAPNPALVGQNISFSIAASDPDGDPLTFTWNFGDGSSGSGPGVTHAFNTAGAFTVIASVSDGHSVVSSSVTVTVSSAGSNLVGYWKLNETSGSTAADSSGNGNTGTLVNAPAWTPGKINGALRFDGVTQYVDCGNASSLNPASQITLAAWINSSDGAARHTEEIIAKDNNVALQYFLRIQAGGQLIFAISGSRLTGTTTLKPGTWYFVAATYDGAQMKLYINGALEASVAKTGDMLDNGVSVRIGARKYTTLLPFAGLLDEVQIYNRALSQAELATLQGGGAVNAPAPVSSDAAAPSTMTLTVSKLHGSAHFTSKSKDVVTVSGTIKGLPDAFDPTEKSLTLNVGGATATFTLNEKGHASSDSGVVTLKLIRQHGSKDYAGGDVQFSARITGSWAVAWGMDPTTTVEAQTQSIPVVVDLDGTVFSGSVTATCSTKANSGGTLKK